MVFKKKKEIDFENLDVDEEEVVRVMGLVEKMRENGKTESRIEKELRKIGYSEDFIDKLLGKKEKKKAKKEEEPKEADKTKQIPKEYQVRSRKKDILLIIVLFLIIQLVVAVAVQVTGIYDFTSLLQ